MRLKLRPKLRDQVETTEELNNTPRVEEEAKKHGAVDVAAGDNLSDVEEEEFLSAVIDDVVDDVQQIIDNHRAVEPRQRPGVPSEWRG